MTVFDLEAPLPRGRSSDAIVTMKYRDAKIVMNTLGKFRILWGGEADNESGLDTVCDSLIDAKAEIDKRLRLKAKAKKINQKLLTDGGLSVTAVGIHIGTGKLIVKNEAGKSAGYDRWNAELYPDTPHTRGLVGQLIAARKRLADIEEELEGFKVPTSFRSEGKYYRARLEEDDYPKFVEQSEQEYAEKRAQALELGGDDE